eukprot:Anaeramoba_ignava/a353803_3.p2 GENE.a353803_3~~a353803_3.p2  ORF type:complete len:125 (-),score=1.50 a353803_3:218-592(-)
MGLLNFLDTPIPTFYTILGMYLFRKSAKFDNGTFGKVQMIPHASDSIKFLPLYDMLYNLFCALQGILSIGVGLGCNRNIKIFMHQFMKHPDNSPRSPECDRFGNADMKFKIRINKPLFFPNILP